MWPNPSSEFQGFIMGSYITAFKPLIFINEMRQTSFSGCRYRIHVASHGIPGALGVPYRINHDIYGCFRPFFRRHASDTLHLKRIILLVNVTSFDNAVTSYVTSQCHTCIGHMTIYYKRATNASVRGVSVSSLVR